MGIINEHTWIAKANLSPRSKQLAINAFCFQRMGMTLKEMPDYGWKELIRTCTAPDCPLYIYRPYQVKKIGLATLQKNIDEECWGNHNDRKNQPTRQDTVC
jgi:hypothetical protein